MIRRSAQIFGALAILATSSAIATGTASADAPVDLYVTGGASAADANPCTVSAPCRTVQHAVDVAGTQVAVVHVGAGTFDGDGTVVAAEQHVSVVGSGPAETELGSLFSRPVFENHGALSVSGLTVSADFGFEQDSGSLAVSDVDITQSLLAVRAHGGAVGLSRVDMASTADSSTGILVTGAHVRADHTTVVAGDDGIAVSGGSFAGRDVVVGGTPRGVAVDEGDVALDRSSVSGSGDAGLLVSGSGAAVVTNSTFSANSRGARVTAGTATLVADSFGSDGEAQLERTGGNLLLAASVIAQDARTACVGSIVDGGYNLAADTSCNFSDPHSVNSASRTGVHRVPAIVGGRLPDVYAPDGASRMLDAIPVGAVAAFDPSLPLCIPGSTDQLGTARPQSGRCDIGAVEALPVHLGAALATRTSTYGGRVRLTGSVLGDAGRLPQGRIKVTYSGTPTVVPGCSRAVVSGTGTFGCTITALVPGNYRFRVEFVPTDTSHSAAVSDLRHSVFRAAPTLALRLAPNRGTGAVALSLRATSTVMPVGRARAKVVVAGRSAPGCATILVADGRGTCSITGLTRGSHRVIAHFLGNQYFAPARISRAVVVTGR